MSQLRSLSMLWTVVITCVAVASFDLSSARAYQLPMLPSINSSQGRDVVQMNRGPLHEAFAQPYELRTDPTLVIDRRPPEPVLETPPREIPLDQSFRWIPGYWGWEPAEQDFVWVSGIWRRAPEEMVWTPGSWQQTNGGYAWASGYWARDEQLAMVSTPPPAPHEEEPGQAPAANHFYVPGHWANTDGDYEWRPGFWAEGYDGRVWTPTRYVWTPDGYVVAEGYWDYELEDRGIVFSPVRFEAVAQTVSYTPSAVVRVDNLPTHMFVYPDYGHYCYGNYYGTTLPGRGIRAWTQLPPNNYDPLHVYFNAYQPDNFHRYRDRHQYYLQHPDYRPRDRWAYDREYDRRRRDPNSLDALLSEGWERLGIDDGYNDGYRHGYGSGYRSRFRFGRDDDRWNRERYRQREYDRKRDYLRREMKDPGRSLPNREPDTDHGDHNGSRGGRGHDHGNQGQGHDNRSRGGH